MWRHRFFHAGMADYVGRHLQLVRSPWVLFAALRYCHTASVIFTCYTQRSRVVTICFVCLPEPTGCNCDQLAKPACMLIRYYLALPLAQPQVMAVRLLDVTPATKSSGWGVEISRATPPSSTSIATCTRVASLSVCNLQQQ